MTKTALIVGGGTAGPEAATLALADTARRRGFTFARDRVEALAAGRPERQRCRPHLDLTSLPATGDGVPHVHGEDEPQQPGPPPVVGHWLEGPGPA